MVSRSSRFGPAPSAPRLLSKRCPLGRPLCRAHVTRSCPNPRPIEGHPTADASLLPHRSTRPSKGGVAPGLSAPRALKARALGESGLKPFHGTILPAARPRARTVATIPPAWPPSFTHRPAAAPHLQSRSAACLPAGVSKPAGRLAIHTSWAGLRAVTGPLDPTIRLQPRG